MKIWRNKGGEAESMEHGAQRQKRGEGRGGMEAEKEWRQRRDGGRGGMEAGIKICIHGWVE